MEEEKLIPSVDAATLIAIPVVILAKVSIEVRYSRVIEYVLRENATLHK